MSTSVSTYIYASDPISLAGVTSQLRARPEIRLVDPGDVDNADVAVVVANALDEETLRVLRALRRGGEPRTVLVADVIDDRALVAAAEAGVCGLLALWSAHETALRSLEAVLPPARAAAVLTVAYAAGGTALVCVGRAKMRGAGRVSHEVIERVRP